MPKKMLPYPLNYDKHLILPLPQDVQQGTGNDARPPVFLVPLCTDSEAFLRLLSAASIGADIIYPDDPLSAYADLLIAREYINRWWEVNCVDICALVADCIENNPATQQAIANAIRNSPVIQQALRETFNPSVPGDPIPDNYANNNQYGAALGCNNDDGWGHIRDGLINRSFQRVIDVLEQIESVTNNQEMLAQFLNAIPAIGAAFDLIPVTDWVLWFDNVRAWMKETFDAADTIALRDQIACDLFCIWQDNCSLSIEQIRRYYWNKTIELVPSWSNAFNSLSELATALGFLSQVNFGSAVVYALVGSQYGFQTFVNDWFGITIESVSGDLALGEPSDDWMTLCPDCPLEAENVGLFSLCGSGIISEAEFESGVPFDIDAYEINVSGITNYVIALRLPAGNWNVTLNSFTGTISPPVDTNETAYAWHDTSGGFHNVTWNTPATPADFGNHDTTRATFAPWCASQDWNAYLNNATPFTANFTVTAI